MDEDEAVNFARQYWRGPVFFDEPDEIVQKIKDMTFLSPSDPDEWDYWLMQVAGYLRRNDRVPNYLAAFAADVIEGKKKRPNPNNRAGNHADVFDEWANVGESSTSWVTDEKIYVRNYQLWKTAKEVKHKFDLPLYSNNELSEKMTAAQIVSKATGCSVSVVIKACQDFERIAGEKN